jgi:hypothetical protein
MISTSSVLPAVNTALHSILLHDVLQPTSESSRMAIGSEFASPIRSLSLTSTMMKPLRGFLHWFDMNDRDADNWLDSF